MSKKINNPSRDEEIKKRVEEGWNHMIRLAERVENGEASAEEAAEYQAAIDRQKGNKGLLGGG